MYKLLIVDDEMILRTGLRKTIDWNSFGFEVVGEAADGRAALKKIGELAPDVVLTDIRMPVMGGLEMLEKARDAYPNIKFVILSGFEEFEYAKKALTLGAVDYVSKLTLDSDIPRVFSRVKKLMDEKTDEMKRISSLITDRKRLHDLWLYHSILNGSELLNDVTFEELTEMKNTWFCIAYYCPEAPQNEEKIQAKLFLEECGIKDGYNVSVIETEGTVIAVHYNSKQRYPYLRTLWENVSERDALYSGGRSGATIVLGREFFGIEHMAEEYALIKRCAFNCTEEKVNGIITAKQRGAEKRSGIVAVEKYSEWLAFLMDGNRTALAQKLKALQEQLLDGSIETEQFYSFVVELISFYSFRKKELGDTPPAAVAEAYEKIPRCKTGKALFALFERTINACATEVELKRRRPIEQSIEIARQYIDNHYCEKLSLKEVANIVYLSPAYFSNMFKTFVGVNFGDYICAKRMARADEYLKQGRSVTHTAEMVGYNDMKHFGKIFKKYHDGKSPSDFMRK